MERAHFVWLPGELNKLLFIAGVENYFERGMGEHVLLNSKPQLNAVESKLGIDFKPSADAVVSGPPLLSILKGAQSRL